MNKQRRSFVEKIIATGLVSWLVPGALSANWPKPAFDKTELTQALKELIGDSEVTDKKVSVTAPQIAENGGQVRVEVKVDAQDVEWIGILVEKNPVPLTSKFVLTNRSLPHISANIKVRETSEVIAIAKAGDEIYRGKATVRVTAGGCA